MLLRSYNAQNSPHNNNGPTQNVANGEVEKTAPPGVILFALFLSSQLQPYEIGNIFPFFKYEAERQGD